MNDLELHDLVRGSLKELRPVFNESHWRLMQFKLITANVLWPLKLLAPIAVPVAAVGALWYHTQTSEVANSVDFQVEEIPTETASITSILPPNLPSTIDFVPIVRNDQVETDPEQYAYPSNLSVLTSRSYSVGPAITAPSSLKTFFMEREITALLKGNIVSGDSTTYKVLDRNKQQWENAVVVCDWTSSMFRYGTQIFAWLNGNHNNQSLKGYVFFNDCDIEGSQLVSSDIPGAMFHTAEKDPDVILNTMIAAVRNGVNNSDLQENDLEAIQFALTEYPEIDEIILIADNRSPVRNPHLLKEIAKPVRIILCGSTLDAQAIQGDYLNLARFTGGSIHTIEDDLLDLNHIPDGQWIKVGDIYYRYKANKDRFISTNRKKRPGS